MAQVLILGGGYGGLRAALRLASLLGRNGQHEITLVDQNDFHQIIVRLHEVAGGALGCDDVIIPFARLLQGKGIRFQKATVTGIKLSERQVETTTGTIGYDKLVIAVGSETNYFGVPGLKENSLELKSYQDACRLRNHVEQLFAKAKDEPDPARRRELLTLVVGGGGFTGTELAGEFADFRDGLAKHYGTDPREARVVVVEAKDVLLGGFDAILVQKAIHFLEKRRVELTLGTGLKSLQDGTAILSNGQSLTANTIVWTGGVKASSLVSSLGLQTGAGGRAMVNPYSEAMDYAGVYLVGDCALVLDSQTGRPLPPSAQLALQQGSLVAYNISAELRDRPRQRFEPKIVAEIVSLGHWDAIALIGPFRLSGLIPSLLKRIVAYRYVYSIGGLGVVLEKLGIGKQTSTQPATIGEPSSVSERKGRK